MIVFQRTAIIAPGKTGQAMTFAHVIAKTFEAMSDVNLKVMIPVGGNPNRIAQRAAYKNLTQLDEVTAKMMSDEKYRSEVASASDLFITGSIHHEIWRTVQAQEP